MRSSIFIHGVNIDQIKSVLHNAKDAMDPLNYFGFSYPNDGYHAGEPSERIVVATKQGANAGFYVDELQNRLNELGLQAVVNADPTCMCHHRNIRGEPGRPPLFGETMNQTAVRLPSDMIEWLKRQDGGMSETVRRLVEREMSTET